jgi:hypothetical protein
VREKDRESRRERESETEREQEKGKRDLEIQHMSAMRFIPLGLFVLQREKSVDDE